MVKVGSHRWTWPQHQAAHTLASPAQELSPAILEVSNEHKLIKSYDCLMIILISQLRKLRQRRTGCDLVLRSQAYLQGPGSVIPSFLQQILTEYLF